MEWLLAAVALVLLVVSKGFRKVTLILVIIGIFLGVITAIGFGIYNYYEKQTRLASRKLIPLGEIELIDLRLGNNKITGRVRNNSKVYTLTKIGLDVTIHDVTTDGNGMSRNDIIGENKGEEISVFVPPGQVRDFDDYIWTTSTEARGKRNWTYDFLYSEAKK